MTRPSSPEFDDPIRVEIVCLGNICRSPMGAAVLRDRVSRADLEGRVVVASAGTGSWHVGGPADARAAAALRHRGYDDSHVARQFDRHDFADFDLIPAADASNLHDLIDLAKTPGEAAKVRLLRSFDSAAPEGAQVPDPYLGGEQGFNDVLDQIEAACDGLIDALRSGQLDR